ncbi:ERBB-3 BINDING PROTEIN 1 isoform X2 [Iris pallida]|uniref:ERBB-3 BINDING PROTEIN 1 isoform X2 n=1 Tax=Iris pallida TaxID=29817 RepID=A0AAX6FC71_IRIPA|nr:ERBB-3 BINDING PROTEIN 1 isoform X2 [Iris pallida]
MGRSGDLGRSGYRVSFSPKLLCSLLLIPLFPSLRNKVSFLPHVSHISSWDFLKKGGSQTSLIPSCR